jgi:putative transposase
MHDWREQEALFRYGLVRELADEKLGRGERGALLRALASQLHQHPSGCLRAVGRSTLERWLRGYRAGGFEALKPRQRQVGPRTDAALLAQAAALKREAPGRTGAQIAVILARLHGEPAPSTRTVQRHLARLGLNGKAPAASRRSFGRFQAERPNELWICDFLHGPSLAGRKAILLAILDDHSRLVVCARFGFLETTLRLEALLRSALERRGLPEALYVDNGGPFVSGQLKRICACLDIRLSHSKAGRPQGRGKVERFFRTLRGDFLVELAARAAPPAGLDELNRLLEAWLECAYHRRVQRESDQTPLARFSGGGPPRYASPALLREAFLWRERRQVSQTATVSLQANSYEVDHALVGRTVELLFDPYDLSQIEVRYGGRPFGLAAPKRIGRHVHPAAQAEAAAAPPPATGIDYLALLEAEHRQELERRQIAYRQLPANEKQKPDLQEERR